MSIYLPEYPKDFDAPPDKPEADVILPPPDAGENWIGLYDEWIVDDTCKVRVPPR